MSHIIQGFVPYEGVHCETTAMGNLLQFAGIWLSEPMLFGLGEGLGFIYWDSKNMDFPFIGGRIKTDRLSARIAFRPNLTHRVQETSSIEKARKNVQSCLERGIPVGLKLDSYYLDYFTNKVHFAGHYAVIYGMDEEYAYMADTRQQGGLLKTRLDRLAMARNAKGPMSSRNLSFTIEPAGDLPPLKPAVRSALSQNAHDFLNPPIQNAGHKGILKMSKEILKWPSRSKNFEHDLCLTALLMERGGTGGALFRNLYRDFLNESAELLEDPKVKQACLMFERIAPMWTAVSSLIDDAGKTGSFQNLEQVSRLLLEIADQERTAMELLL